MVDHYAVEDDPKTHERVRRIMPHEKPWVFCANVNELGDTTYHGPRLEEIVAERAQRVVETARLFSVEFRTACRVKELAGERAGLKLK